MARIALTYQEVSFRTCRMELALTSDEADPSEPTSNKARQLTTAPHRLPSQTSVAITPPSASHYRPHVRPTFPVVVSFPSVAHARPRVSSSARQHWPSNLLHTLNYGDPPGVLYLTGCRRRRGP